MPFDMSKIPTISVVTICFNSADTVEETMLSVVGQGYPALDYVVIDGGSTDGTLDIIRKYQDKLGYFVSEPDKGISDAFNKGVAHSKGELVVIINSDDILCPNALNHVAEYYEEGKWDIYRGNVIVRNKKTGFCGRDIPSIKFPLFPWQVNVDHQGTFVTRDAYVRWGGYDISFQYMMDHDFLARCYQGGARMRYVPVDVAEFRLGGVSVACISSKRYDIEHVVLNQGGSKLLARLCYWYFWLFEKVKLMIISICGIDSLKRMHYGRT
ncbi:MAG: glycosyltransferase [Prevotellaceae bacterium]|nr:glycosyltransferase [Prevotellaceae bacterium]